MWREKGGSARQIKLSWRGERVQDRTPLCVLYVLDPWTLRTLRMLRKKRACQFLPNKKRANLIDGNRKERPSCSSSMQVELIIDRSCWDLCTQQEEEKEISFLFVVVVVVVSYPEEGIRSRARQRRERERENKSILPIASLMLALSIFSISISKGNYFTK